VDVGVVASGSAVVVVEVVSSKTYTMLAAWQSPHAAHSALQLWVPGGPLKSL